MVPMAESDGPSGTLTWKHVLAFTRHAEAVGLDSVWVCDHLLSEAPGGPVEGIHEGWTITSAIAASTSTVEVGQLVTCMSFRDPGVLAKMAVTAEAISGGRLLLGVGAGWYDREYEAAAADRVGGHRHLREQSGVAERHACDELAQPRRCWWKRRSRW